MITVSVCVHGGGVGGGGGGWGEKETDTNGLGADNPSCYPKAEVETTPPGFLLPIFIYMMWYSIIKKG